LTWLQDLEAVLAAPVVVEVAVEVVSEIEAEVGDATRNEYCASRCFCASFLGVVDII
jgi:hypothetical protein